MLELLTDWMLILSDPMIMCVQIGELAGLAVGATILLNVLIAG
jgi:hypothetical protein